MIELPLDKDGEVIRIGDIVDNCADGKIYRVRGYEFRPDVCSVLLASDRSHIWTYSRPNVLAHKKPVTIALLAEHLRDILETVEGVDDSTFIELSNLADNLEILGDSDDFPATNAASFNIYAPDGAVMATAQVTPGRVTITYTSWVEGKDRVQGTLWLAAHVKADAAAGTTMLRLIDEVTGQVVETSFETRHYGTIQHEVIAKWGVKTDHGTVEWSVRLNHAADNLTNVVLEDTAQEGTRIIPGSFRLYRVHMDAYSNIDPSSWVRVSVPEPVINGSGFTWDLSSVDFQGNQYFMYYETEGTGTTSNAIQLKSRETTQGSRYQFVNQESGGNGNGDNRPQPTEPETPPTQEPNPGPQPQPTPQDVDPEPQPKPEPAKPVKKVKKKAVLPSTGDTQNVAVVAGIGVIAIIVALVMSMPLRRD